METMVICNNYFKEARPDMATFDFDLCNQKIVIGLLDVPEPNYEKFFTETSVLVLIKAFSCNYRDKSIMLHFNKACLINSGSGKYFYSPFGSEFVAEVIRTGAKVRSLKAGDRVIPDSAYAFRADGSPGGIPSNYASQRIQVFRENQLIKIPDNMPDETAAAFTIASQTVYSMFRRLSLPPQANVLVTAATSNTSLSAITLLKNRGMNIFAVSSNKHYEKELAKMGVSHYIPYQALATHTMDKYIGQTLFDAVIDPFFDLYFNRIHEYMNYGSKYIYCGLYKQHELYENTPEVKTDYSQSLAACIPKNISLLANCLGERKDLETAVMDFSDRQYRIIIDSVYTDKDVIPFLQKTFHSTPRFGKVVYHYN